MNLKQLAEKLEYLHSLFTPTPYSWDYIKETTAYTTNVVGIRMTGPGNTELAKYLFRTGELWVRADLLPPNKVDDIKKHNETSSRFEKIDET